MNKNHIHTMNRRDARPVEEVGMNGGMKERIYLTQPRPQITELDKLPFVDRSMVDYEKYNRYTGQSMVKNCLSLQGTRGCPFRCLYCHKIWPKKHYVRSAENIFAEVTFYYHMGVRRFSFVDDVFNLNIKNSSRFFELIIKNRLDVQLFFPGGFRGDKLTKPFIDLAVEAGTLNMAMALETASLRLQKLIQKNLDIDKLRDNMEYVCQKYPHVLLEIFILLGIPTETEEEAMLTLDFLKSLQWVHFPYISILKIFPNTDMEQLAIQCGISRERILKSLEQSFDEISETLPFSKSFAFAFQAEALHGYFLLKERLMDVLPHQMKVLTEDEMVQKYNSYLPGQITSFPDLLQSLGLSRDVFGPAECPTESDYDVPDLNKKFRECFSKEEPDMNALNLLLLDISQYFSGERDVLYDVCEPPLGLMYLMTGLKQQQGNKINGKIAKSRMDFDNYSELKELLDEFQPDVIGIRSLSLFKDFFHQAIAKIRQWGFHVPIIAGGPYATSDYLSILNDQCIDVVVLGEGEITFCQLISEIMKNNGQLPDEEVLKEIPGIAFVLGRRAKEEVVEERRKKRLTHFREELEDE